MILRRRMAPACLLVILLVLSACGNATATDNPQVDLETQPLTRAECLAIEVKEDKIACFQKLAKQKKAELEATQQRVETLKSENEKRRERNEALLKEFERGVLDEE